MCICIHVVYSTYLSIYIYIYMYIYIYIRISRQRTGAPSRLNRSL